MRSLERMRGPGGREGRDHQPVNRVRLNPPSSSFPSPLTLFGPADLPNDPSARLTALLRLYAPKSLPGIQGLTVVSTRPNRGSRRLSLAEARESLTSLRRELETDEAFFAALSVHEKLDLVRAVSTIARAVLPIAPDQVLPPLPGASADSTGSAAATGRIAEEQARIELRHGAAEYMRDLMRRGGLDALEAVGASPGSGTRSSAALLLLDAATLADEVVPLSQALHTAATSADARSGDGALLRAVRTLFRPLEPPAADDGAVDLVQASAREGTRRQNAHVALALILEALERSPHSDASDAYSSAPAALDSLFYLGAGELLEFVLPGASTTSRQRQVAFNDVLRRRYGVVLGRLEPTPARWFEREVDTEIADASAEEASRTRERLAALGLHLVRHLARAGSAGEAFSVWQTLVGVAPTAAAATSASAELRASPPKLVESLSDLERLEALALLVDGLALQRLYADANTLATELEDLARAVQIGGEGASEDASSPMAAEAYRALARLAAGQGRSPILDRVLSRLASLCEGSQGAATPTEGISLEAAARRMRARSRRYELDEVRAIFDEADLDRASPEERARLWGQLVAAYVRVNDVEGGLRALQDMLAAGLYVPATTINVVLHGFARRGDLQRAAELFGKLADGDFPRLQPDTTSWNALVLAHSVARDPSTIEGLIREMRLAGSQPTRQTWTTLLSAYVENGQFTAAFRVYRFLQMHPDPTMRPDTAVYNVMLKACILTSTPATTVVALFRDLIRRGVRPNMRTYTLVLQSVSIAGIMDVAEELYLLMDRRQDSPHRPPGMSVIEPDQFVFSTLVAGYLRRGDGPKARAMLEEMTRRGIRPSSVTVGILIAARIDLLQRRGGSISPAEMQRVIQQARDFLERGTNGEAGGLAARKRRQPVRFDRPLALGREATVVYAPILRSLAKQGDVGAALELFEEILDRQDSGRAPPVELYTTLMDAFRQQESEAAVPSASEGLAQNVYTIWGQLYDSVCDRFVRLRPVENAPALAPVGLPLPRFSRRVDPAQAGLLRLPLTILLDTASRLGDHALIESTWRRLIQQGFAFDTSNWNALASWFIRDLQLEKALWITEQVLCRAEALEEVESPERGAAFAAELAAGGGGVGNKPMTSRLWQARTLEAPASESRQVDLSFLHDEAEAPQAREGPHPEEPTETASSADVLESTSAPLESSSQEDGPEDGFTAAFPRRAILATLPYRRTLEALEAALDHLAVNASFRAEINSGAGSGTSGSGSGASSQRPPLVQLSLEAAQETYRRLVEAHPRTMQALKALRSRRRRAESERYERSKGRY